MIYDEENDDYQYNYHDLVEDSEDLSESDDEYYYDDGTDEPWAGLDEDENETMDEQGWGNYYHNIADEIIDD